MKRMPFRSRLGVSALLLATTLPSLAGEAQSWPQLPYAIVDSGQETCFDQSGGTPCPAAGQPFYGQDGQIRGNAPRYRDNGDGTVSDLVTGLSWQKAFHQVRWSDAAADARAARTGGHTDWRVPTIKELYSLMQFSGRTGTASPGSTSAPADARPYLDTRFFAFEYSPSGRYIDAQYISSTPVRSGTMRGRASFFGVNFADGRIKGYPQDGNMSRPSFYVRYVRGNPDYGRNAFVDNGDGSISDRATGLTWAQGDSGDPALAAARRGSRRNDGLLDWQEALQFCASLTLAGQHDWRLPNAKELQSLVDYQRTPATSQSAAINPLFRVTPFRNEAGRKDYPYFWTSTTHLDGPSGGADAVYIAFGEALGYFRAPGDSQSDFIDVHGAGAQRSDPKAGNPASQPLGHGPQGDIRRIYNAARCVRGGGQPFDNRNEPTPRGRQPMPGQNGPAPMPSGNGGAGMPPGNGPGGFPPPDGNERRVQAGPGNSMPPAGNGGPPPGNMPRTPPPEAIAACAGKSQSAPCAFTTPFGDTLHGNCAAPGGQLACLPQRR